MITNKDIRVENGSLIINGDPYPLDGQSPEAIMQIVKDNSDTTPTAESTNPVTSAGIKSAIDVKAKTFNNIEIIDEVFDILFTGSSDTNSRVLCPIKFPFAFANNDYTLTCSKVEIVGVGEFTTGITPGAKYRSGALIIVSTTSTAGSSCVGTATIHISRANS